MQNGFYPTNRRRKLKYLPREPNEKEEVDSTKRPQTLNRRHPVKVMLFEAIIAPDLFHNFDGKVMLERMSEKRVKVSGRNRKSDDLHLNYELKVGNWKRMIIDGQTLQQLLDIIIEQYILDEYIV